LANSGTYRLLWNALFLEGAAAVQSLVLELQLRGPATDPTDTATDPIATLRILYGSYESADPSAETRSSAGRQQYCWNKDIESSNAHLCG
jgi:hypothetical protein